MHWHKTRIYSYVFMTLVGVSFHVLTLERVLQPVKNVALLSMPSRVVRIDTSDEFQTAMDNRNVGDHMMEVDRSVLPGKYELKANNVF
ncbi:MAG: hypothetical protein U1E36_01385 [Rickettsiales bacterium]